jgi:hypothetical protein
MRIIKVLFFVTLGLASVTKAADQEVEPMPYREFQFNQAVLLIHDCHIYSFQLPNGNGPHCLEIYEQIKTWTRERYAGESEAVAAISSATHVREAYVPIFALVANSLTLNPEFQKQTVDALKLTLDKMAGFRGHIAFQENESRDFIRFVVDALVAMAISGADPKGTIEYLNAMALDHKPIREAFDLVVKKRIRFLFDYVSAKKVKTISIQEKVDFFAGLRFRPFEWDLRMSSQPRHLSGVSDIAERLVWRKEAEKLVIDKPMLGALEGLLQNYGVKVPDVYTTAAEGDVVIDQITYPLHEMGQWAGYILTKLGYDIEQTPRNDGRKKKKQDGMLQKCIDALVPQGTPTLVPIPVSSSGGG